MMSKPAVHSITASESSSGAGESIAARTAIHAPVGAIDRHHPRTRCDNDVNRFVYEYSRTEASATGERISVSRLSMNAAMKKSVDDATVKAATKRALSSPAG